MTEPAGGGGEQRSEGVVVPVTIVVPTFRRLDRLPMLLTDLQQQCRDPQVPRARRWRFEVLVVDNDPAGSAVDLVHAVSMTGVRAVVEPLPGVAAVRNRGLDEADPQGLLVFIDDDERPTSRWLAQLLQTWLDHRPAAVAGRVLPQYEAGAALDPWIEAGRFFVRRTLPTGTRVTVAAANNLLLDVHQVRRRGVRFDEAFGALGGEDSLFSRQLVARGGEIVWCDEGAVLDVVPLARTTRRWVLTRAVSHGNSSGLVDVHLAPSGFARAVVRLRLLVGGVARVFAGLVRAGLGYAMSRSGWQARGARTACRGVGMLAAAGGFGYEEYGRPAATRRAATRWRRCGSAVARRPAPSPPLRQASAQLTPGMPSAEPPGVQDCP